MDISLFGAGFVGGTFADAYPDETVVMERDARISLTPNVLNFISTITNYHPKHGDFWVDIETNLSLFMEILVSSHQTWGEDLVFNQISSWFVYGNNPKIPAKEDSCCDPKGFYSITARAREQLLISYCETFGVKYRILRLANIIGVGDYKISLEKNALQFFCQELAVGRPIQRYRQGSVRDYMDVRDCVEAIHLVLERGKTNEIYNIANGQGLNVKDLIDRAHRASGYRSKVTEIDVPEFHKVVQTPAIYMDISKIKNLGYIQRHDIKKSIEELVHHYESIET